MQPTIGRVLVIDYTLPTPDQDAGAYRMVQILKAIRGSGNHVTFVPADLVSLAPLLTTCSGWVLRSCISRFISR